MKYYKDAEGKLFGFRADGSQDQLIGENLELVTLEERDEQIQLIDQENFDALPYDQKRLLSYPPIADFMDGLVKGDTAQMQAYIDQCKAVKLAYPAPQ